VKNLIEIFARYVYNQSIYMREVILMAEFAKIFKQLRLERELSQSRLADQLGISKSAVNMYERGDRRPDFETAEVIADFFNVDMNYLLGYSDKITRLSGDHTDPTSGPYVEVTAAELELLKAFRHAGAETQAAIRAILHI
jgi:transcriptional regulator with XRE-family HTH domain